MSNILVQLADARISLAGDDFKKLLAEIKAYPENLRRFDPPTKVWTVSVPLAEFESKVQYGTISAAGVPQKKLSLLEIAERLVEASPYSDEKAKIMDFLRSISPEVFRKNPDTPAWAWVVWATSSSGLGLEKKMVPKIIGEEVCQCHFLVLTKKSGKMRELPNFWFIGDDSGISFQNEKPEKEDEGGEPIDSIGPRQISRRFLLEGRSIGREFNSLCLRRDPRWLGEWDVATISLPETKA